MSVPILLVAGFLGAGKTTVVNHILAHVDERRIAALINDFGAINIDAELIAGAREGIVSLANGCICCSLEGDLLRTLAAILRRNPRPEAIVIETSGVADPADIVRNLMDPVIWREAPAGNGAVRGGRDGACRGVGRPAAPLATWGRGRGRAEQGGPRGRCRAGADPRGSGGDQAGSNLGLDALHGKVPSALLFPQDPDRLPAPRDPGRRRLATDRFETLSWISHQPVSLPRLQGAIGQLAPRLARAKGLFETVEQPGRQLLFQLAGGRATLAPAGTPPPRAPRARIVFIAEIGVLSTAEIGRIMDGCASAGPG